MKELWTVRYNVESLKEQRFENDAFYKNRRAVLFIRSASFLYKSLINQILLYDYLLNNRGCIVINLKETGRNLLKEQEYLSKPVYTPQKFSGIGAPGAPEIRNWDANFSLENCGEFVQYYAQKFPVLCDKRLEEYHEDTKYHGTIFFQKCIPSSRPLKEVHHQSCGWFH
uniref:Uncharacterized protein n=1 Tax=Romanomermis culicivorax TaxID=13658 RepID=A0A915IUF8_ROMCU